MPDGHMIGFEKFERLICGPILGPSTLAFLGRVKVLPAVVRISALMRA